jgi:L-iditol 2-dehydrogenase
VLAGQILKPNRMEIVEVPAPTPGDGQVLVKGSRVSVCGSDVHILFDGLVRQYPHFPGSPGHEAIGQVTDSRSEAFAEGDWVLAVPNPPAARCYAEQFVIEGTSLIKVPEGADPNRILMGQQLGTTVYAFRRHWPPSLDATGKTVAICGAGSAGLFFVQLARLAGFEKVIIADLSALRLKIAEGFGADVVVHVPGQSFVEAVLDETGGAGADLVIEAVGFDATRIECLEAVKRGGRVGYFGFPEAPQRRNGGPEIWSYSKAWAKIPTIEVVTGTQLEPGLRSFHEAVDHIASGRIDVDPFLEPLYPLADVQEALEAARDQLGGKIAVELQS